MLDKKGKTDLNIKERMKRMNEKKHRILPEYIKQKTCLFIIVVCTLLFCPFSCRQSVLPPQEIGLGMAWCILGGIRGSR